MGKLSKEEAARFSGANWLLNYAEEHGIDEARKELERRGVLQIPLNITKAQLREFTERTKMNILRTVLLMSEVVLYDEFDFTRDMLIRFKDRFELKTKCLLGDYVNWEELQMTLKEELDIDCPLTDEIKSFKRGET